MTKPNAICTTFRGSSHMRINVYFDSLDSVTLPILSMIREWRNRNIKVWLNKRVRGEEKSRRYVAYMRNSVDILDDVSFDRSVCYLEWDVATFCVKQIHDNGTCALLSRPWADRVVIVGKGERTKKRLVAFSDAVQREDMPEGFIKIPWVNTCDQLLKYCLDCGVFAFSLKDERRFASTGKICKGAQVFREYATGYYYCMDTLHYSHYELFDRSGRHLAEVDLDGNEDRSKADCRKRVDVS